MFVVNFFVKNISICSISLNYLVYNYNRGIVQYNFVRVFNSRDTSNDVSSSDIQSVEVYDKIQKLRRHIKKTKKVIYVWFNNKTKISEISHTLIPELNTLQGMALFHMLRYRRWFFDNYN